MIFTDAPEVQRGVTLEDLPGSFGDAVGASAKAALYGSPTSQLYRTYEDYKAGGPNVDYETARTRAKDAGVDIKIDPKGIGEDALNLLIERKRTMAKTNDAIARGPQGFLPGTAYFLSGMGASLLDPINLASSFIPIARPLGMADDIARAGALGAEGAAATAAGRFAARARVGAVEGAGGQALVEPLTAYRASQEQEDYTITDTLLNIGFGTVLGSVAHTGLGALGDRAVASQRADGAKALIDAAKTAPETVAVKFSPDSAAAKLQSADMATVSTVTRAAIASELDGRMMNLETLVPEKVVGTEYSFTGKNGVEYTLKIDPEEGTVVALDPEGNEVGSLMAAPKEGYTFSKENGAQAAMMEVDPTHQRNGVNTAMNTLAEQVIPGYTKKSGTFTPDGQAWFDAAGSRSADLKPVQRAPDPNAPKPDVDPNKVQDAAKASQLPENDVHYDAQAKAEVDEAISTKSADRDPADIVNESLLEMQTELATLQKQMGMDPEKNSAMRAADETVATADKYTKAIEAYATCQVRT